MPVPLCPLGRISCLLKEWESKSAAGFFAAIFFRVGMSLLSGHERIRIHVSRRCFQTPELFVTQSQLVLVA